MLSVLAMSGCAARSIASDKPELASISVSLMLECAEGIYVPEGALDDGAKTAGLWIEDRASLQECRERHKALVEAINTRSSIQGQSQ